MPPESTGDVRPRGEQIPVESLLRELDAFGRTGERERRGRPADGPDRLQQVLSTATELFPGVDVRLDEDLVKGNLDEVLLMLISLRSDETHGKGLIDDLDRLFDARLSPGTVYPQLHELESEGLLRVHEKVRTKEYHVGDDRAVRARLERTMCQHLALGYAMYLSLEDW